MNDFSQISADVVACSEKLFHIFLFPTLSLFCIIFCSYNDSSRSHGGGGGGGSNLENFNTYGLSVKFLEGLGITQGPLHNKVFVANVSIFTKMI